MIAFLTLCYCGVVWLVFFKLKLLNFDTKAKIVVTTIGVLGIFSLVIAMNLFQPFCASATLFQRTTGLVPNVSGDVLEVNVEPNVPLKKGDVIFRIDPALYQAEVDRLKALLAQAEQNVPQLKASLDALPHVVASVSPREQTRSLLSREQEFAPKFWTPDMDSNFFHPLSDAVDDISVNPILTTLHRSDDA